MTELVSCIVILHNAISGNQVSIVVSGSILPWSALGWMLIIAQKLSAKKFGGSRVRLCKTHYCYWCLA